MQDGPYLLPRQWWRLHAILARIDCDNEQDNTRKCIEMHDVEREDLRALQGQKCIRIVPGPPGYVRVTLLKYGETWVERYRRNQLAQALSMWEYGNAPLKGTHQ